MPPEDDSPQPAPESPSPAIEAPAPAVEPVTPPAPAESVPATETAQPATPTGPQGPLPFSTTDDRQENQVAQIPPNEPIAPESEPIAPTPAPVVTQPEPPPPASASVILAPVHAVRDLLNKARVAIQDRKRKKRDKIMTALNTKNKITNDEVEKLLHVSDATATRYLSALEKENKIKQVGKTGHGVVYSKI